MIINTSFNQIPETSFHAGHPDTPGLVHPSDHHQPLGPRLGLRLRRRSALPAALPCGARGCEATAAERAGTVAGAVKEKTWGDSILDQEL